MVEDGPTHLLLGRRFCNAYKKGVAGRTRGLLRVG